MFIYLTFNIQLHQVQSIFQHFTKKAKSSKKKVDLRKISNPKTRLISSIVIVYIVSNIPKVWQNNIYVFVYKSSTLFYNFAKSFLIKNLKNINLTKKCILGNIVIKGVIKTCYSINPSVFLEIKFFKIQHENNSKSKTLTKNFGYVPKLIFHQKLKKY